MQRMLHHVLKQEGRSLASTDSRVGSHSTTDLQILRNVCGERSARGAPLIASAPSHKEKTDQTSVLVHLNRPLPEAREHRRRVSVRCSISCLHVQRRPSDPVVVRERRHLLPIGIHHLLGSLHDRRTRRVREKGLGQPGALRSWRRQDTRHAREFNDGKACGKN